MNSIVENRRSDHEKHTHSPAKWPAKSRRACASRATI